MHSVLRFDVPYIDFCHVICVRCGLLVYQEHNSEISCILRRKKCVPQAELGHKFYIKSHDLEKIDGEGYVLRFWQARCKECGALFGVYGLSIEYDLMSEFIEMTYFVHNSALELSKCTLIRMRRALI